MDRHGRRLVRSRTSTGRAARGRPRQSTALDAPRSVRRSARARGRARRHALNSHALSALSPPSVMVGFSAISARLQAERIRSLLADRSGKLWIGHDDRLTVVVPAPPSASPGAARSIPEASSACRSGSEDARLPVAPGEACRFETLAGLPALARSLSEGSDGRVLIGTPGGLIRVRRQAIPRLLEGAGASRTRQSTLSRRTTRVTCGSAPTPAAPRSSRATASSPLRRGRAQAQLRHGDFPESGRSSASPRRVAGPQ